MSDTIQQLSPQLRMRLAEVGQSRTRTIALTDATWFTDAVGTFVAGASYLLGGSPGSRKSGLAAQIALDVARQGRRVLMIPTEEPQERVLERLLRMVSDQCPAVIERSLSNVIIERNPPPVEMLPQYVANQILSPSAAGREAVPRACSTGGTHATRAGVGSPGQGQDLDDRPAPCRSRVDAG